LTGFKEASVKPSYHTERVQTGKAISTFFGYHPGERGTTTQRPAAARLPGTLIGYICSFFCNRLVFGEDDEIITTSGPYVVSPGWFFFTNCRVRSTHVAAMIDITGPDNA
jgi:hypothetical protein